jgi:hypothetical protein
MSYQEPNNWTIMVYLAGDNNLAEEMVYALKCMDFVGSHRPNYEVIALYDAGIGPATLEIRNRAELPVGVPPIAGLLAKGEEAKAREAEARVEDADVELKSATVEVDKLELENETLKNELSQPDDDPKRTAKGNKRNNGEAKRARINHLAKQTLVLRDAKELRDQRKEFFESAKIAHEALQHNEQSPEPVESVESSLTKFVVNTIQEHPARNYMLVLSGHGSGAVGDFLAGRSRFFGLSIPGLRQALAAIRKQFEGERFPGSNRQKIDILGLDSCLMGMAEVAYEVRDYVQYLVGAEGFEPNTGWPYDRILSLVRKESAIPPAALAQSIVREYIGYYGSDFTLADVSTDQSAFNLDRIDDFMDALGAETSATLVRKALADKKTAEAIRKAVLGVSAIGDAVKKTQESVETVSKSLAETLAAASLQESIEQLLTGDDIFKILTAVIDNPETQKQITEAVGDLPDLKGRLQQTLDSLRRRAGKSEGLAPLLKSAIEISDEIKDAVVLAHWEAQGYKNEQHIDVKDFCDCLKVRLERITSSYEKNERYERILNLCADLIDACARVKEVTSVTNDGFVLASDYCGPAFQHSRGVSIFFPWANMTDARGVPEMDHYQTLDFARNSHWDEFVRAYHQCTQRPPRPGDRPHISTLNRRDGLFTPKPGKFGTELSARFGTELSARFGTELSARFGTELSARFGTELSARFGTELSSRFGTELSARFGTELSSRFGTELSSRFGTELSARFGTELSSRFGTELSSRFGTELSSRFGTELSSRGGGFMKIASMKNPPIKWFNL